MIDSPAVKILPPFVPIIIMALGAVAHQIFPLEIGSSIMIPVIGSLLVVLSIPIVGAALKEILGAETAFDVRKPSTTLVTSGIFQYSRNLTYLSMIILCFGISFIANSWLLIFAAALAGSGLCVLVIRQEESYLQQKFGQRYHAYCSAVRRWI